MLNCTVGDQGDCEPEEAGSAIARRPEHVHSHGLNRNRNSIEDKSETRPPEAGGKHPPTPLKGGSVKNSLTNAWSEVCCYLKSDLASTACSTHLSDEYDRCFP